MITVQFTHNGIPRQYTVEYNDNLRKWVWTAAGKEDTANTLKEAADMARRWIKNGQ